MVCSCPEEAWGDGRSREEVLHVRLSDEVGEKAGGGGERSLQEQVL